MAGALRQVCTDCGFIYDPAEYGEIPLVDRADWECPGIEGPCGAAADKFEIVPPETALEDEDSGETDVEQPIDTAVASKVLESSRAERAVIDLARMYDEKELILQPDWQRDYVWSNKQASQLVESLFLRLPIPLIYLFQERDGTLSVVDGQQRLTALIEFVRNKHCDPLKTGDIALSGLEELTHLNGKRFTDLSIQDQQFIKNQELSTVRMSSSINPDLKLEVFRRLNTGSVKLNAQELRNAAYRGPYNDELKKWAQSAEFRALIGRKDRDPRMLDVELVLRFCAWVQRGWHSLTTKNLSEFLDREMEYGKTYKIKELTTLGQKFRNAVSLSHSTFGNDRAFRRYRFGPNDTEGIWEPKVNKAVYDVVMYGFARYSKAEVFPHIEAIRESFIDLMATDPNFQDTIAASTSDSARVNYRFTTWLARLESIVGDDPQKRTFTRNFKQGLFNANPTCGLCGQQIVDLDDAHVHHVEAYWRGGKTIPQNAALTHRFCNMSLGGG